MSEIQEDPPAKRQKVAPTPQEVIDALALQHEQQLAARALEDKTLSPPEAMCKAHAASASKLEQLKGWLLEEERRHADLQQQVSAWKEPRKTPLTYSSETIRQWRHLVENKHIVVPASLDIGGEEDDLAASMREDVPPWALTLLDNKGPIQVTIKIEEIKIPYTFTMGGYKFREVIKLTTDYDGFDEYGVEPKGLPFNVFLPRRADWSSAYADIISKASPDTSLACYDGITDGVIPKGEDHIGVSMWHIALKTAGIV